MRAKLTVVLDEHIGRMPPQMRIHRKRELFDLYKRPERW